VDPLVFGLVAGAAALHVTWNVILKTAGDPLRAAAIGMSTAAAVICPAAVVGWLAIGRPTVPLEAIVLSVLSGFLEAIYFAFLAAAYRRGDLSMVYPLARGTAPLLAVAFGSLVLGERLGPVGDVGVALLLVGLLSLQRPWRYLQAAGRVGGGAAGFAILTGVSIASYSAVDRVAVRMTEPWIYAGLIWATGTVFLWMYVFVYRRDRTRRRAAESGSVAAANSGAASDGSFWNRRAAFGGLITLGGYLMILAAFTVAPLTAVAPLRESAIVLASGWGSFRLGEAANRAEAFRRVSAAALVVVGAILLALD
jgi:uncharacterized membrane protein